jgi:hypothetical protein
VCGSVCVIARWLLPCTDTSRAVEEVGVVSVVILDIIAVLLLFPSTRPRLGWCLSIETSHSVVA